MNFQLENDAGETASQLSADSPSGDGAHAAFAFTCLSCQVAFSSPETQRDHMRTDWHRYNLKRKAADLPPVAAALFAKKLIETQSKTTEASVRALAHHECAPCRKSFASENAFNNHLASKKHRLAAAKSPIQSVQTSITPTDSNIPASEHETQSQSPNQSQNTNWHKRLAQATTEQEIEDILQEKMASITPLTHTDCLFCPHVAESFEANLTHMETTHSFFIPYTNNVTDPRGFIKYLGEKITVANVCIYCNGRGRALHSVEAVRDHMTSKGHCKVLFDDEDDEEYAEFYDFEGVGGSEGGDGGSDASGDVEMVSAGDQSDEDGWVDEEGDDVMVDDEDIESCDDDEVGNIVKLGRRRARLAANAVQLEMPSGARAGHRAYRSFWRQRLPVERAVPGSMRDPAMQRAALMGTPASSFGMLPPSSSSSSSKALTGPMAAVRALIRNHTSSSSHNAVHLPRMSAHLSLLPAAQQLQIRRAEVRSRMLDGQKSAAAAYQMRTRAGFAANNQKYYKDHNLPGC